MMLRTRGLAVARGGARALEGLDLDLPAERALVVRGPNGIGKTTLLRTIAGLQPPVEGAVEVAPDAVAYAAHADGLKTALTVTENLAFWRAVFGGPPLHAALVAFDLVHLADRPAHALSAGQKRRLGLARLAVTGRPLWVLDEPTVSLDAASVALFAAAVRAHLAGGGSALIATHVDLGLTEAETLDLTPYRALAGRRSAPASFDEAFA